MRGSGELEMESGERVDGMPSCRQGLVLQASQLSRPHLSERTGDLCIGKASTNNDKVDYGPWIRRHALVVAISQILKCPARANKNAETRRLYASHDPSNSGSINISTSDPKIYFYANSDYA